MLSGAPIPPPRHRDRNSLDPPGVGHARRGGEALAVEPATRTAALLTRRWVLHVLGVLGEGPARHNELRRAIDDLHERPGVHDSALTRVLRQLEIDGLLERTVLDQHPPGVRYALTPAGRSLLPVIRVLADWDHAHGADVARRRADHDTHARRPARPRASRA